MTVEMKYTYGEAMSISKRKTEITTKMDAQETVMAEDV